MEGRGRVKGAFRSYEKGLCFTNIVFSRACPFNPADRHRVTLIWYYSAYSACIYIHHHMHILICKLTWNPRTYFGNKSPSGSLRIAKHIFTLIRPQSNFLAIVFLSCTHPMLSNIFVICALTIKKNYYSTKAISLTSITHSQVLLFISILWLRYISVILPSWNDQLIQNADWHGAYFLWEQARYKVPFLLSHPIKCF